MTSFIVYESDERLVPGTAIYTLYGVTYLIVEVTKERIVCIGIRPNMPMYVLNVLLSGIKFASVFEYVIGVAVPT